MIPLKYNLKLSNTKIKKDIGRIIHRKSEDLKFNRKSSPLGICPICGKNVFLNTLVGIEYGFSYYKKDITNVFMQEIAPQLGFGIGVQNHHQIEFVLSMPFFSRLKFEIQSFTFVVPRRFEHIRFGLNYFYRF